MTILQSFTFRDWSGNPLTVHFMPPEEEGSQRGFQATIITGQNGSHKSTLLKELVAALTIPGNDSSLKLLSQSHEPTHVVCISGAVADRFPSKEISGGGLSDFDVPNYSYLGQRIGSNLLSKKRPLETLLTFALAPDAKERFEWDFFEIAHKFASIQPYAKYELHSRRNPMSGRKGSAEGESLKLDVLGTIQRIAVNGIVSRQRPWPYVSQAMAHWILEEFRYEDFNELEALLSKRGKRVSLSLDRKGATCDMASCAAIRLGLLTNMLVLTDVRVRPIRGSSDFSAFDLSSGEFHMYSSILGLGFGMKNSSVVLVDEPENSLHPQWQQDFMEAIFGIGSKVLSDGHILICTHSPLIVSAAAEGSYIVDLTNEISSVSTTAFGASSDEVLLSQFGIASSRNRVVAEIVQRAVSLVERDDFNDSALNELKPDLMFVRNSLRSHDPLIDIIDALLDEGGR